MTRSLTYREVVQKYGLTRRQVEYLIEKGGLRPMGGGYGRERLFDETEQRVLSILRRLIAAGWSVERARPVAREMADLGIETARLPGDVIVTIPMIEEEVTV